MTVLYTIKRAFRLMVVLSILTIGGAVFYEHRFVSNGIKVIGEIKSFKKKPFSSAQEDPIEMEIVFYIEGKKMKLYSSRNVVEHILGTYKVGDEIPVVYNPDQIPSAKIGNAQHLYRVTLTFLVIWGIFFVALAYAWRKAAHNKPVQPTPKSGAADG